MSPTRRDIWKLSAGAVSAALATGTVGCQAIEPALATSAPVIPEGHIRKAEVVGVWFDRGSTESPTTSPGATLFVDGDLDNTWTIHVHPQWRGKTIFGGDDETGIVDCRTLSANDLMSRMWRETHLPIPTVLAAEELPDLIDELALIWPPLERWIESSRWYTARDPVGVAALNDRTKTFWGLVAWNHPMLDAYPGYNALIEYQDWYYLALLDPSAVSPL